MRALLFLVWILSPVTVKAEDYIWFRPWSSATELANILRSVPEGKALLDAAEKIDPSFLTRVQAGNASQNEKISAESYLPLQGKTELPQSSRITLKRALSLADAATDFTHELLHFTKKEAMDPYQPGFGLEKFVRQGIEGKGGELEALATECRVSWALEKIHPAFPNHRVCQRYRKEDAFQTEKARADYYAIGIWLPKVDAALRKSFPELGEWPPMFTSGLSGKPYPVALAEEFERARKAACEINRWKYRMTAVEANARRLAASADFLEERKKLEAFDKLQCHKK